MRFGLLILPELPWPEEKEQWVPAEAFGFDHAWTYDHLTWRSLQNRPWFASMPTLTAAALATKSIRLGTLVASPNFREPSPFAKEIMTIDQISQGRFTLGFGAGADGYDATSVRRIPCSARERQGRFREFVSAINDILRHDKQSFAGEYYVANETRSIPGCFQKPWVPVALAGTGRQSIDVVAEYGDTWVGVDGRGIGR